MTIRRRHLSYAVPALLLPVLLFIFLSALYPLPPLKPYSLVIEDRHGQFLHAFLAPDGTWRLRTSPEEIPDRLKAILLRREDRWFRYHPGVNGFSLVRAAVQNVMGGRRISGASTITMQIARLLEPKERTYAGKLTEMFRALQLEWKYSKEELLEIYLSMVPLGGNVEGLKSASLLYYQTPLERLNIAQVFDLILLPGDPNGLRPDLNPDKLLAKRKRSAEPWIRAGLLTAQDSVILWTTPAAAQRHPLPCQAPHFALRIKERNRDADLVRSTLDLGIQKRVERLLTNHLRPWKMKGVRNGAVLVVDNRTNGIVAYVGSEDFHAREDQGQVDAVVALRSPGSALKPFLYAMLIERGVLTPRTRLIDTPYDAEGFLAENYDGTYSGLVYADEALRRSLNVPMIRLLRSVGLSSFLEFLQRVGVRSLDDQQPRLGLSLILGGCGVTLEELTAAYAAFPRGGLVAPLRTTADAGANEGIGAFSPSTAFMVTEILAGLDRPDLPNNFDAAVNLPAIAFKTGTSYGRRDAWAIGFTAEYTVGVWTGNMDSRGNPELVGSKTAAPLLIDIMNSLSRGRAKKILRIPVDVGMRMVCAKSGRMPTQRCTHLIEDSYSRALTLPLLCDVCREYLVAPDGSASLCLSCVGDRPASTVLLEEYPPELLAFWRMNGVTVRTPPAHNPLCVRVFSGEGPTILSPSDGMTYYLFSGRQQLFLKASSGLDVRHHLWYIDRKFLGRRKTGENLFVRIGRGEHTITCVDDRGRSSHVKITVYVPTG